jgi:hypothetical protein
MKRTRNGFNQLARVLLAIAVVFAVSQLTVGPTRWLQRRGWISAGSAEFLGETVHFPLRLAIQIPYVDRFVFTYLWLWDIEDTP